MMIRFLPVVAFALLAPLASPVARASDSVSKSYGMPGLEEKKPEQTKPVPPASVPAPVRVIPLTRPAANPNPSTAPVKLKPSVPDAAPVAPKSTPAPAAPPAVAKPALTPSPGSGTGQPGQLREEPKITQVSGTFTEQAAAAGSTPKFMRINVKGYHIRTSPEFDVNNTRNVERLTQRTGETFPVLRVMKLRSGTAVNILVDGKERWVFVPNWRKNDFQFCESAACFTDLTEALAILQNQGISSADLASCGIDLSYAANAVLPSKVSDVPLPKPRPLADATALNQSLVSSASASPPRPPVRPAPPALRPSPRPTDIGAHPNPPRPAAPGAAMTMKPMWENASAKGSQWTAMMRDSIRKYGQDLLNPRGGNFADAEKWCPRYGSLSQGEREEFLVHLFNGVARYESQFKPDNGYDESTGVAIRGSRQKIDPHTHSLGFFQLSYGSTGQAAYRNFCKFDWNKDRGKRVNDMSADIFDVKKQMDCAVGIMNYTSKENGVLAKGTRYSWTRRSGRQVRDYGGGSRFWSTLRDANDASGRIRAYLAGFKACGVRTEKGRTR